MIICHYIYVWKINSQEEWPKLSAVITKRYKNHDKTFAMRVSQNLKKSRVPTLCYKKKYKFFLINVKQA